MNQKTYITIAYPLLESLHDAKLISDETMDATKSLIWIMGEHATTFKIAPCGQQDLILVSTKTRKIIVLMIDGWRLHMVISSGPRESKFYDGLTLSKNDLPTELKKCLDTKDNDNN